MRKVTRFVFALAVLTISGMIAGPAFGQTAVAPYQLTVFAKAPTGLSAPDSVAVLGDHVFVGYGDGHLPDGSDGLSSQIVEYRMDGSVVYTYTVVGHNDGLKFDPSTHLLWALQNEDANANLVIINTETHMNGNYLLSVRRSTEAATTTSFSAAARSTSAPQTPRITRIPVRALSAPAWKAIWLPSSPCLLAKQAPSISLPTQRLSSTSRIPTP